MTSQEKLIKFVELKDRIIKRETSINYIDKGDINEIKKWNRHKCKKVYEQLKLNIRALDIADFAVGVCPWCIDKSNIGIEKCKCKICGYAKRHGDCINDSSSLFHKYYSRYTKGTLSNKVYKNMISEIERR